MKRLFILLSGLLLLLSCKTDGMLTKRNEKTQTYLVGKIYDGDNSSCSRVKVSLYKESDDEPLFTETSDVTGSVYFPPVDFGEYVIKAEKTGYLDISFHLTLELPEQSLYLNMLNEDQLIDRAVGAMESENYPLVRDYLDDLESISGSNPYGLYIKSILAWKSGDSGTALSLLDALIKEGEDDFYILKLKDRIVGEQAEVE